ncbi:MAG TPA: tRNA guanosine(34) transglycosylase Tgt [Candidatus Paceibacterota bacterium]
MNFKIEAKVAGTLARAGRIETAHGFIETPALTLAATKATVKTITPEEIKDLGGQSVLANTYHLYLQPGDEIVKRAGGLHKFMHFDGPIFTDSGGFQAFSLGEAFGTGISKFTSWERTDKVYEPSQHEKKAKVDDDGVTFYSHINGDEHRFTPERSIEIQHNLGADIIFAFDECVSPHAPREAHERAVERTRLWAERCIKAHRALLAPSEPREAGQLRALHDAPSAPSLWGIVQGGRYEDLRRKSAREIAALGFEGFGIGGSFVKEDMGTAVRWVCEELPEDKPRHLLGVGEPADLFAGVENGIDTFDCVAATRKARTGGMYTKDGEINITNAKYREEFGPIEKGCACYTCTNYSAAYVHHLFKSYELLAYRLTTIHNLYFIVSLMKNIRQSILDGSFEEYRAEFLTKFNNLAV